MTIDESCSSDHSYRYDNFTEALEYFEVITVYAVFQCYDLPFVCRGENCTYGKSHNFLRYFEL